jgi:hypothetical protein
VRPPTGPESYEVLYGRVVATRERVDEVVEQSVRHREDGECVVPGHDREVQRQCEAAIRRSSNSWGLIAAAPT